MAATIICYVKEDTPLAVSDRHNGDKRFHITTLPNKQNASLPASESGHNHICPRCGTNALIYDYDIDNGQVAYCLACSFSRPLGSILRPGGRHG